MPAAQNKIAIVGSGNVAYHFAKVFSEKEIPVEGIFSRNEASSKELSYQFQIKNSGGVDSIQDIYDLYLVCVSDDAISDICLKLQNVSGIVAHTSGSVPLQKSCKRNAVFYPLQTFSKNRKVDWKEIPILIESENKSDGLLLYELARTISNKAFFLNSEKRKKLHIAAVIANNFTNFLLQHSFEILNKEGIPKEYLYPLLNETITKAIEMNPENVQTGPAKRNDTKVINEHLRILEDTETRKLYQYFSEAIIKKYHTNE